MAKTDSKKKRTRKTGKAALIAKLQAFNAGLGVMLTPKYKNAGEAFVTAVHAAQEAVVAAGMVINGLPDGWKPAMQRVRKVTPERLQKLREQAEKLAARIEAAEAAVEQ